MPSELGVVKKSNTKRDRRGFVGGSDARVIMGRDEKALTRLWKEKRGEISALDLSGELIVQLGLATEDLNRLWFERQSGHRVIAAQRHVTHRTFPWMAATLDGVVEATGAVFEAKFMLPWSFSEAAAAEKHMAQLQHYMLVADTKKSILSIINGGGQWIELSIDADPVYQTVLIAAEKAFWRAVKSGEPPALFDCEPPKPRVEAIRVVDMNASNSWAQFAALYLKTREAHLDHERAKSELKTLMPEDAKEAMGYGVRARRSKSGAVSFDLVNTESQQALAKPKRIPPAIAALLGDPVLMRGERSEEFEAYLLAVASAVGAHDIVGWSQCSDMTHQTWEIRRFQKIRAGILLEAQVDVVADLLRSTYDGGDIPASLYSVADAPSEARKWVTNKEFGASIDERLAARGHDSNSVLADAYRRCALHLSQIDKSISDLEARRIMTLREIARHDAAMAKRLGQVSAELIEGEFTEAAE